MTDHGDRGQSLQWWRGGVKTVVVSGSFDDLRSRDFLFLEKASLEGELHAVVWDDETARAIGEGELKFSREEREYLLQAVRYVTAVHFVPGAAAPDAVPTTGDALPDLWIVREADDRPAKRAACKSAGVEYQVVKDAELEDFPPIPETHLDPVSERKKVIVTGCYDWFHSGHVAFFEEVAGHGDLYVVVGHDENIKLLKGEGHPLFPARERRYVVQSIRYVKQALVSTGHGWMDAEPEIAKLQPDAYAVNEDGDKPEKRAFCEQHGLEYIVLKRVPKEGLPKRESTALRGF
jgi:cytidyltransferase-like protein